MRIPGRYMHQQYVDRVILLLHRVWQLCVAGTRSAPAAQVVKAKSRRAMRLSFTAKEAPVQDKSTMLQQLARWVTLGRSQGSTQGTGLAGELGFEEGGPSSLVAKHLLNSPKTAVQECLDSLLLTVPHITRLDGFPEIKVAVNINRDASHVAVISGGGAGHEPAHAGLVGSGMLTAAVCGEIFASPTVDAILAAIRTVTGSPGCLLIVKNYTGDRIAFGQVAEMARAEGYEVEMVVVDDDCVIQATSKAGKRGIAGTVLVHKVAGHVAQQGGTLDEVRRAAEDAVERLASMGTALTACTVPTASGGDRQPLSEARGAAHGLGTAEMEVGMGIHGEPGRERTRVQRASELVGNLVDACAEALGLTSSAGRRVVLLVNNLGGLSGLEMAVATRCAVLHCTKRLGLDVARVLSGALMTSLDMAGVSVTLLDASGATGDAMLDALDTPTDAPGWPRCVGTVEAKALLSVPAEPAREDEAGVDEGDDTADVVARCLAAACDALAGAAARLNDLDAQCGDGDTGSQFALGAEAVAAWLVGPGSQAGSAAALLEGTARVLRKAKGGTSGALYVIGLFEAARHLRSCPGDFVGAMEAAISRMCFYGGAEEGDRTMLDALIPAAQAMQAALAEEGMGADVAAVARVGAEAAAAGAAATASMEARAGRSSYVPADRIQGCEDPGAAAVAVWMDAVAGALE